MNFIINRSPIYLLISLIAFASVSFSQTIKDLNQSVASNEIKLKNCIQVFGKKKFVIKTKKDYLEYVRKDAQTEQCINDSKSLDFEKYSYVGLEINSGYCRRPRGLEHKIIKDQQKKQYVVAIKYIDPQGQICRARSQYDLWIQASKFQEGYKVLFEIVPINRK